MSVSQSITRVGKNEPFELQISRGQILNHEVRNIFGWQSSVTTAFIPLWENATAYTYPSSALPMTVTSASASDDGGTITIIGLDINYNVISETVTCDNASAPVTTKGFFRINDVIFSKSTGVNVGLITISNGATTYAKIAAGVGRNQASIYTVPAGHCFYLYRIDAFSNDSTASKPGLFRNFVQNSNGSVYVVARTTFSGNMNIQRRIPFKYNEKTDIQFQLSTLSGTHEMNVFGEGVVVQESYD
jgi:hypothetical protein